MSLIYSISFLYLIIELPSVQSKTDAQAQPSDSSTLTGKLYRSLPLYTCVGTYCRIVLPLKYILKFKMFKVNLHICEDSYQYIYICQISLE